MSSSAANPDVPTRLAPAALLQFVSDLRTQARTGVLLVVALHRPDRLSALAQQPAARLVIAEIIPRIEALLRPADHYSLVSHDEVWVVLADLPGEALAELAARSLHESLSRPIRTGPLELPLQLQPAIGGAWQHPNSDHWAMAILSSASDASERARRLEERILIMPAESDAELTNRALLEQELRVALRANALAVHFQPQISLATGRCTGAEALVRWTKADGTQVSPALIASICETRGMMTELTQFVLNTALRNQMGWDAQGIDAHMSINLSAVTLADAAFPTLVSNALATWGIDPSRLTLELTESAIVQHEQSALAFMRDIRDQGCGLALDDFGTGYSSFAYLQQYPITELKIDQSFVRNLVSSEGDRRIVHALVDLAHTFGMRSLAEGVEDASTARVLHELGCEYGQGYHFSKALPEAEFARWWHEFKAVGAHPPGTAIQ